uniref:Uncharacterized protein n=1 Tax=Sphaerodactylus townsendi TaxID=933632 RepID=A0ACB8GBF5_9SAUR
MGSMVPTGTSPETYLVLLETKRAIVKQAVPMGLKLPKMPAGLKRLETPVVEVRMPSPKTGTVTLWEEEYPFIVRYAFYD